MAAREKGDIIVLSLEIPDRFAIGKKPAQIAEQMKLSQALVLYRDGEYSLEAACEFCGKDLYSFMQECARHGIDVIDYDEEELIREVKALSGRS